MHRQLRIADLLAGAAVLAVALGLLCFGLTSRNLWALHACFPAFGCAAAWLWIPYGGWRAVPCVLCISAWLLVASLWGAPIIWLCTFDVVNPIHLLYASQVQERLFWWVLLPVTIGLLAVGIPDWLRYHQRRTVLITALGLVPCAAIFLTRMLGVMQ
jgi:hypothetical protein